MQKPNPYAFEESTTLDAGNAINVVTRGTMTKFYSDMGETEGFHTSFSDGSPMVAGQTLFQDQSEKMLFLTPNKTNVIVRYDTETGTNLGEVGVALHKDSDSAVDLSCLSPARKFDQLRSSSTHDLVGVSRRTVLRMQWDPRVKASIVKLDEADPLKPKHSVTMKTRNTEFTAAATNAQGHVVVADNKGAVRLYTDPTGGKFSRAKTALDQLADPIIAVDVSSDGEWVLWTTKQYLAIVSVAFTDTKGNHTTGFKKAMGKNKQPALLLRLSESDLQAMGITEDEVDFTPAKFDNGPALGAAGILEEEIVTTSGQYVVRWKMRQVKLDYAAKRNMEGAEGQQRRARLAKQNSRVLQKAFAYDSDRTLIAALADQVDALNLDSPSKSKVLGSSPMSP